jgi:hypothetical protein
MSRKWTLLTLILFLGSSGALRANPLDSPGIVYIDGLPCNRACQAYMAWSRPGPAPHRQTVEPTIVVVPAEASLERRVHSARPRVARQPMPVPRPVPRAGMAASNAKPTNAKASHSKNAAAPRPANQATAKAAPLAAAAVVPEKAAAAGQEPERKPGRSEQIEPAQATSVAAAPPPESAKPEVIQPEVTKPEPIKSEVAAPPPATLEIAAAPSAEQPRPEIANAETAKPETAAPEIAKSEIAKPEVDKPEVSKPEVAKAEVATLPTTGDAAPASAARTIQQQIAEATGMAERVTAITLEREQASKAGDASDADAIASVSPGNLDNLVAVVLARPEINSLSDLNNKNIAIGEKQSAAGGSVSAALMAAGAAEIQLSEGKGEGNSGAIDRLISGEVPAAVLALASPEAAEWFPDIAGFRIFRLPLSRRARL